MRRWFKEYSREQHLLLALPHRSDVWRDRGQPARLAVRRLYHQLAQQLHVACMTNADIDFDDIWLRDTLPMWFQNDPADAWQGLLPKFNGWGGVQSHIAADQTLARRLFEAPIKETSWHGEGGMFSHNGEWVLVGLRSLKQRNPMLTDSQLRALLVADLAPLKPLFFDTYLSADETLGHIDNMALFIDDNTVVYSFTDDPSHPDYAATQHIRRVLNQLPDTITRISLPLPHPEFATVAERRNLSGHPGALKRTPELPLLCSYVNVIAVGDVVVFPQYQIAEDIVAASKIQSALPNKKMITTDARELVLGGGGLHCISHSRPTALAQFAVVVDREP